MFWKVNFHVKQGIGFTSCFGSFFMLPVSKELKGHVSFILFLEVPLYIFRKYFIISNSVGSDQTLHSETFDFGTHCMQLQSLLGQGTLQIQVKLFILHLIEVLQIYLADSHSA